ncbi:MAG TPA: RDD family protein [Thermoanaerobaculia bacterium]|nr:RDD family protein [Thermoanaerobaculia bacterium]
MKRRNPDEPELWERETSSEETARDIDRNLEGAADDPLGRVLIRHPPALFPEPKPADGSGEAPPPETVPLFSDAAEPRSAGETDSSRPPRAGARLTAFLADASLCAIVASAAFLAAAALVRRAPTATGWLWCALFALLVSFFLVVPTLALFGRTPGMALADLTADDETGEKPPLAASVLRWAATAATAVLAGIPLATMLFDRRRRTPADLLSGRPLLPAREPAA